MNWNLFNAIILVAIIPIVALCLYKIIQYKKDKMSQYIYWYILLSNFVIIQVILIDSGITKMYPLLLLFYMPFQFLCPTLFTAFAYAYIERAEVFKKYRTYFLIPFFLFFGLYTFFKLNVLMGYSYLPARSVAKFNAVWDENSALAFALMAAIWNYRTIKKYENSIGSLPYQIVQRKTQWLKKMYFYMVFLCLLWLGVIIGIKVIDGWSGHGPYYPLWGLFIVFYYGLFFLGKKHLNEIKHKKELQKTTFKSINDNFQISALQHIFNETELLSIHESRYDVTEILGYFATSLFDKKNETEVVWDITKNCIAKLGLEDCVVYFWNENQEVLQQKAAYGSKNFGNKKVLSPIEIQLGKGIVGTAGKNKKWELVNDVEKDNRYLLDDKKRRSELAVPLVYEDRLLGVLDSESSKKDFFTERHLLLFQLIAKLTATKLAQINTASSFTLTNDNIYYKELLNWFEKEKPYLNPSLSLVLVSEYLNISAGYLSQIVNTLGGMNFSEFINLYRVNESKKMLTGLSFSNYTIVSIGLEAGFNSKSVFYTAFKKRTGLTPSEYRQQQLMLS
ncbi:helix-turn-helix domain-containing protein [Flagellimonas eckloniae]|uniref:helix-turn-helix domain-containing protein n=1 Tax=Flagellimonas eckloniae TaxID=346185 RepID=UPI0006DD0A24|nr:helix-turn-helix domain-containing protein [Allomuricauda eckloniae]